jgi:hypothetical protein
VHAIRLVSRLATYIATLGIMIGGALAQDAGTPAPTAPTPQAPAPASAAEGAPAVLNAAPASAPTPPSAAAAPAEAAKKAEEKKEDRWYDKIKIRGYTQFRYNRIPSFDVNDKLVNDQGDRYLGKGNGFCIRRARVILYGDVHHYVAIYLQTDFASVIDTQLHVPTMRDWYADIALDYKKTFRFRVGQSKVPFGFENLQSSQNRLALDRNDALNSAVKDERDIGVFMYWAPAEIRARFKHLVDSGLKGSGDYGVVGFGAYNGQTANRPALEDNMHGVLRVTWPFLIGEQFLEVGGGGYYGQYRISTSDSNGITYATPDGKNLRDGRGFASVMLYPQPFGFLAEGNYGIGPAQGEKGAADRYSIEERTTYGAYAQVMYKIDKVWFTEALIPYARATYYRGGKKFETNAPLYLVKEVELGIEWQILKAIELTLAYDFADRTSSRAPYNREKGQIARVQLQVNY